METRVGKWGNSLALRIPQPVAAQVGLSFDAAVELTPRGEELVISVVKQPRTQLEDLLAAVTEANLHGEVDSGPAVGREVW